MKRLKSIEKISTFLRLFEKYDKLLTNGMISDIMILDIKVLA